MKFSILLGTLLTMVFFLTATAAPLGGGVPAAVHYINHETVTSTMVKGGQIVKASAVHHIGQSQGRG